MEEKVEAEILYSLKDLKRIENYRTIVHKYRKSDKIENLYKLLDFSEVLADCHPKRPSVPCSAVSV